MPRTDSCRRPRSVPVHRDAVRPAQAAPGSVAKCVFFAMAAAMVVPLVLIVGYLVVAGLAVLSLELHPRPAHATA